MRNCVYFATLTVALSAAAPAIAHLNAGSSIQSEVSAATFIQHMAQQSDGNAGVVSSQIGDPPM
ncbi:hypothetical protein [Erythrobacter sp. Alg231-14]|uniref:hypothetical protein n=1 Tax=Erythrobacter sp. Alg231-14 TaxID=1922225 RepID=UPI000D54F496